MYDQVRKSFYDLNSRLFFKLIISLENIASKPIYRELFAEKIAAIKPIVAEGLEPIRHRLPCTYILYFDLITQRVIRMKINSTYTRSNSFGEIFRTLWNKNFQNFNYPQRCLPIFDD